MTQHELQQLLLDLAAERLGLLQRHESAARAVAHYDFNNAYQYVIAREETHLSWLQAALTSLGSALPAAVEIAAPDAPRAGKAEAARYRGILEEDAHFLGRFVERWRPRVDSMTHARHKTMLNVILGESLEHERLFLQAAGGFEDVLGRRTGGVARTGQVLPMRWIE